MFLFFSSEFLLLLGRNVLNAKYNFLSILVMKYCCNFLFFYLRILVWNSLDANVFINLDFGVKCGCCGQSSLFVSDVSTVPHQGASARRRLLSSQGGEVRCLYRPRGPQLISFECDLRSHASPHPPLSALQGQREQAQTESRPRSNACEQLQIHSPPQL